MRTIAITRAFALLIIFTTAAATMQAQVCQWMKQSNGNVDDETLSSVTDAVGNTYLTGSFDGPQITFGGATLTCPPTIGFASGAFLVKYAPSGNVIWAKLLGGGHSADAVSMTMDAAGNLYVYGNFFDTIITFGATTLTNVSGIDIYLVKLDTAGNPIWARSEQGNVATPGGSQAAGVVADNSGHVVVTGDYDSTITIGGLQLSTSGETINAVYIAAYDTSGSVLWAVADSGNGGSDVNTMAIDGGDNIYIAGAFGGSTVFFGDSALTNSLGRDIFVVKYNSSGLVQWARDVPDSSEDEIADMDADAAGNLYLAGLFNSPAITFGSHTLTNAAYAAGFYNVFVVQYSTSGAVNWAQAGGGTTADVAESVTVTPQNFAAVGGAGFSSPSVFGADTLGEPGLFIAEYSSTGAVHWLKGASLPDTARVSAISCDAAGNLYASGYFLSNVVIDGNTVTDTSTMENDEIFTARFTATTGVAPVSNLRQIALYPNPATTLLNIASGTAPITEVVITDLAGRELYRTEQDSNITLLQVNIASYPAGMYLARINGTEVRKFVKE